MDLQNHKLQREIFKWGSQGKRHNEPTTYRALKDISDSHLLHIIPWIKMHTHCYDKRTLQLMLDEQTYRTKNYIWVKDYE